MITCECGSVNRVEKYTTQCSGCSKFIVGNPSDRIQYVVVCAVATVRCCQLGHWVPDDEVKWKVLAELVPMVLKNKPEYLVGCLNLPGGKIEAGETPVTAAIRELQEETGLTTHMAEYMGVIRGNTCDIHCIKAQVNYKDLKPGDDETEPVSWHQVKTLQTNPKIMPNLRLTIPLMMSGAKGWEIYDCEGGWRGDTHRVFLSLSAENNTGWEPMTVVVKGMAHYKEKS